MVQSGRPVSYTTNPYGWVTQAGVSTNIHTAIDDTTPDAADFIATEGLPAIGDTAEYPIPLMDRGGLYGNGQNDPPTAHLNAGLAAAAAVPATGAGFNALGMSTTYQIYFAWRGNVANTVCELMRPSLAQAGKTLDSWDGPTKSGWTSRLQTVLDAGYTVEDFHVLWVLLVRGTASNLVQLTVTGLEGVLTQIKSFLPNVKQVFFSSYPYGGYNAANEPLMWQDAIVVRQVILNHLGEQNPWVGWGPYLWANGATPRSDGLVWEDYPVDYATDRVHLSDPVGLIKAAQLLENFFQFSPLTPWYR